MISIFNRSSSSIAVFLIQDSCISEAISENPHIPQMTRYVLVSDTRDLYLNGFVIRKYLSRVSTVRCATDEKAKKRIHMSIGIHVFSASVNEHAIDVGMANRPVDRSLTARLTRKLLVTVRRLGFL
jgi:hypothetical protein